MTIVFYQKDATVYAVQYQTSENSLDVSKLEWLFSGAHKIQGDALKGYFIGPRREMITPWSTNAVEITQNMGIGGILRIEEFTQTACDNIPYDPMLQAFYKGLDQHIFTIDKQPDPIIYIDDIRAYNVKEGLALNPDEIAYLEGLAEKLGRKLTDSEVFGFSQVNSEHCRHKIFNGTFIIDGEEKESTLFKLIKKTSQENPNRIVSAYKDNCAFIDGPQAVQFAPHTHDKPDGDGRLLPIHPEKDSDQNFHICNSSHRKSVRFYRRPGRFCPSLFSPPTQNSSAGYVPAFPPGRP